MLKLKGEPDPKIIWRKDDKDISIKRKDRRFVIAWDIAEDLNTLQINDTKEEDSGMYTVEASNALGTVQSIVTVTVHPTEQLEAERINDAVCVEETTTQESAVEQVIGSDTEEKVAEMTIQPEILIKPEDIEVTSGETVKIACKIKG